MVPTYKIPTADRPLVQPARLSAEKPVRTIKGVIAFRLVLMGVCFAIGLLLPAFDQLVKFSANFPSTEKNIPAPLPTFHFPHVRTYIHAFNQYYKENFGWRNALFYQYSQLKYHVLGVSPLPQKVVLGKNGWFFPGNDISNVMDQHIGLQPLTPETLHVIAQKLSDKQKQLAAQGIKFYVVIAPDSYSIYPEQLPDHIQRALAVSNFDGLKAWLAHRTTVPLIDVRPALVAAKSTHVTYMQTDTHWNNYGALMASLAVAQRIRADFSSIKIPDETEYGIRPQPSCSGDLVCMLALNRQIADTVDYHVTPPACAASRETERINNTEMGGLPSQRFVGSNPAAPRLLFVGDSYTISLTKTLPGYFSTAYLTRSVSLRDALIRSEKPDVVIFEIAERNLAGLADL